MMCCWNRSSHHQLLRRIFVHPRKICCFVWKQIVVWEFAFSYSYSISCSFNLLYKPGRRNVSAVILCSLRTIRTCFCFLRLVLDYVPTSARERYPGLHLPFGMFFHFPKEIYVEFAFGFGFWCLPFYFVRYAYITYDNAK